MCSYEPRAKTKAGKKCTKYKSKLRTCEIVRKSKNLKIQYIHPLSERKTKFAFPPGQGGLAFSVTGGRGPWDSPRPRLIGKIPTRCNRGKIPTRDDRTPFPNRALN